MRIPTSTLSALLLLATVVSVEAQPRQRPVPGRAAPPPPPPKAAPAPDAPTFAVGAAIGETATNSQFLSNGLELAGTVERFITPRVSIRGEIGTAWWDIVGLSYAGTLQPVFIVGNVVYNWKSGDWQPYVTGGAGMYVYRFTEA